MFVPALTSPTDCFMAIDYCNQIFSNFDPSDFYFKNLVIF